MQSRAISNIAHDIKRDWKNVNYAAEPYLAAMFQIDKITDTYYYDDSKAVVRYFLANAGHWRGAVARTIKAELKSML